MFCSLVIVYCDVVDEMARSYKRKRNFKFHGNQFSEKEKSVAPVQRENVPLVVERETSSSFSKEGTSANV